MLWEAFSQEKSEKQSEAESVTEDRVIVWYRTIKNMFSTHILSPGANARSKRNFYSLSES